MNPAITCVRSLFWKQPFAALMLHGKIETRTWNTAYRGLVLICATKKPVQDLRQYSNGEQIPFIEYFLATDPVSHIHGHALALGRIVESRPMQKQDEERCMVAYNPALWCHVYQDVRKIKPFALCGNPQGWKILAEEQIKMIEYV